MKPKSLIIAGEKFTIRYVKDLEDFGGMYFDEKIIKIRAGMSDEDTRRTIFHEAIHATFAMAGLSHQFEDDNTEEVIVRALDNLFYPVAKKILT